MSFLSYLILTVYKAQLEWGRIIKVRFRLFSLQLWVNTKLLWEYEILQKSPIQNPVSKVAALELLDPRGKGQLRVSSHKGLIEDSWNFPSLPPFPLKEFYLTMEEFFWRRFNEKGATEPESSLQLTNVSISISHYSWLKHGSLPLCKCTSRAVVWHLGPETWCNISES